jgi:hypothetical protein
MVLTMVRGLSAILSDLSCWKSFVGSYQVANMILSSGRVTRGRSCAHTAYDCNLF